MDGRMASCQNADRLPRQAGKQTPRRATVGMQGEAFNGQESHLLLNHRASRSGHSIHISLHKH